MKTAIAFIAVVLFILYGHSLGDKPDARAAIAAANAERARNAELAAIAERAIAEAVAADEAAQRQQAAVDALWHIEYELSQIRLQEQMRPIR